MHHKRPFLFTTGTGDLWLCLGAKGCGFTIEQLTRGFPDGESVFQWDAQREHWSGIAMGQAEGRDAAIEAACAALVAAGIDLDQLPQDPADLATYKQRMTRAAIEELEEGRGERFGTVEALMDDLRAPANPDALQWLMELADRGINGDAEAANAVRMVGELLDLTGGAAAMSKVQGEAHDLEIDAGRGHGRAGHIGSLWEQIPTWARL